MTTDNTLNTENYTYEPFSHNGFSGSLYLATAKDGSLPKLLIKHENPSSACNEFMYSRLAELLRIHTPKVYLFEVAKKDKRLFKSPYVVGIEYIEGLRKFSLYEMNSKPEWQREYAECYAIAVMCSQDDRIQMGMTPDGHIMSFDYTESFYLPASTTRLMGYDEDTRMEALKRCLSSVKREYHDILAGAGASALQKELCAKSVEEVYPFYLEPFKKLIALTTEEIEAATDPLYGIYPVEVGVYFEEYIKMLQAKMATYLRSIEKGQ